MPAIDYQYVAGHEVGSVGGREDRCAFEVVIAAKAYTGWEEAEPGSGVLVKALAGRLSQRARRFSK